MAEGFMWKHRHTSTAIVFMVWIVSYLDRMVMATAIPYIADEFSLAPGAMGVVMSAFFFGYALFQIPGGVLSDKFGARKVLTIAILWWSALTAVTGAVGSLAQMIWVRVLFGIGEGVAPSGTWRALANWTPAKDRAFGNALMMCSNSLGPALAPLFVVAIMASWGWRAVFYVLFIPGLLMAAWVWWKLPDNPADKKGITKEELDELVDVKLDSETVPAKNMTLLQVIAVPAVWKSFFILFFTNIAAWGFMSWIPSFLVQARGLKLSELGFAASIPFFAGTIGFLLAGWLVGNTFKKKPQIVLIASAIGAAASLYGMYTSTDMTVMLTLNTFTGFFIFCAVAVCFGLPMASVPKDIAGRAMGVVNTGGQVAGFLSPIIVGLLVTVNADGSKNFDAGFGLLACSILASGAVSLFYKVRQDD